MKIVQSTRSKYVFGDAILWSDGASLLVVLLRFSRRKLFSLLFQHLASSLPEFPLLLFLFLFCIFLAWDDILFKGEVFQSCLCSSTWKCICILPNVVWDQKEYEGNRRRNYMFQDEAWCHVYNERKRDKKEGRKKGKKKQRINEWMA